MPEKEEENATHRDLFQLENTVTLLKEKKVCLSLLNGLLEMCLKIIFNTDLVRARSYASRATSYSRCCANSSATREEEKQKIMQKKM